MQDVDVSNYQFSEIPFDDIVRFGQRSLLNNDLFCVSWLLGRYCNYRCSYCWPYAHSDKKDHRAGTLIKSTLDEIKRQARERGFNSFHFSFSGGEPTLHPEYLEILQHYSGDVENSNYQSVHMTTNLSQSKDWFKKYIETTKPLHRASITASYHKEFAKPEVFRDKLILLQEGDIQVTINMVLSPQRFDLLWQDALFFHEAGINVTLKPQSDEKAATIVPGYSEKQLSLLQEGLPQREYTKERRQQKGLEVRKAPASFKRNKVMAGTEGEKIHQVMQVELYDSEGKVWYLDQAERMNAFEFNRFNDWICSSGYRSIIIREPDGVIKRGYSCSDEPLGHIETGFKLFPEPRKCTTKTCLSSADSKIPKRRADVKAPLWPTDKTYEG